MELSQRTAMEICQRSKNRFKHRVLNSQSGNRQKAIFNSAIHNKQ